MPWWLGEKVVALRAGCCWGRMQFVAYDRDLAEQIRRLTSGADDVSERQMFGGLAFLVNGNMAVGVSGRGGLLVRVDPVAAEAWIE